jgi:hypothetical protein
MNPPPDNGATLARAALIALENDQSGTESTRRRRHILIARIRAGDEIELTLADVDADVATDPIVVRARLPHVEAQTQPPPSIGRLHGAGWPIAPLVCGDDASWFESNGSVVTLSRRPTLRRLFAVLLQERRDRPGSGISSNELLARAWPGERFAAASGPNRLYFAIATIRDLGLRPYLLRTDDGYMLDPAAPIEERDALEGKRHAG